jgi:diguanylate cyclase (GGDEF)-like protein
MRSRALLATAASTIAVPAGMLVVAPRLSETIMISTSAPIVVETVAAVACGAAAWHARGRARLVWALFALALAIWAATDAVYGYLLIAGANVPAISPLDIGWMSFYLFGGFASALLYLRLRPERGVQGVIDGLLVTIGVAAIVWVVFIGSRAESNGAGLATLLATAYPTLDLACATALGWIVVRQRRSAPAWLTLIVVAFLLQTVADGAYLVTAVPDRALEVAATTIYMTAGWAWIGAGVARVRAPQRAWAAAAHDRPPLWSEWAPFLIGVGVVALAAIRPDIELGLAAVLAAALMAMRATGAFRVARALLDERDRLLVIDPLTRAYNRRFLVDEGERALSRAARSGEPLSMIALDLDHFKEVNDTLGHAVGDRLLQSVCAAITGGLRTSDLLFRLGGDEFLVLCTATAGEGAVVVAERLRSRVRDAAAGLATDVPVTASLGVAGFPADAPDLASLLRAADTALYDAKALGRDVVARFAPAAGEAPTLV